MSGAERLHAIPVCQGIATDEQQGLGIRSLIPTLKRNERCKRVFPVTSVVDVEIETRVQGTPRLHESSAFVIMPFLAFSLDPGVSLTGLARS